MTAILGIVYVEPDPNTYAGVRLQMNPGADEELFNTGDPTVDYLTAGCVAHARLGPNATVMGLSSIDHFVMDGGALEECASGPKVEAALAAARAYLKEQAHE